jgi:N-acetylglucosaminyl-diphospho-decaprenol L-rhamnosyltransferase
VSAGAPPVTVAVVSWNTRELLGGCLRSLAEEERLGRAEVWVVDNGSSDGSPELVRREFPWATLVEPGENLGFGPAVNLVAERTSSAWIAPSNADVVLTPGALEALLAAGKVPRVGVVAPRLILPAGRPQHSVYPFPTVSLTLLFNLGLQRLSPRWGERMCLEGFWDPDRPREVDWAIGAFLIVRRAAFEAVGGFDPAQWMFAEDLDLGWRLHDEGWLTRYEPRAVVHHEAAAATAEAFAGERTARFTAASYAALVRRRGLILTWLTAAINCAGAAARLAWMSSLARFSRRWRVPRDLNRMWLAAHRQGLRSRRALLENR